MSDSLKTFLEQRRSDVPPSGQAISDNAGWTDIATVPSTVRQYQDPSQAPVGGYWYRNKQTTVNRAVIPYQVQFRSGSTQGNPLWNKTAGGTGNESGQAITKDSAGNVYMVGYFQKTLSLGGAPLTVSSPFDRAFAMYLVKYDVNGVFQFSKKFDVPNTPATTTSSFVMPAETSTVVIPVNSTAVLGVGMRVSMTIGGTFLVTAINGLNVTFKNSPILGYAVNANPGTNIPIGQIILPFAGLITPNTIRIDGAGNIIVGGHFEQSTNVGGSTFYSSETNGGKIGAFLAKYDSSGNHTWSFSITGTPSVASFDNSIFNISIDSTNGIAFAGYFSGQVNVQGTTIFAYGGSNQNLLLGRCLSDGTLAWVKNFNQAGSIRGTAALVDSSNNVFCTLWCNGTAANINFGTGFINGTSWITKFLQDGTLVWARGFGTGGANDDTLAFFGGATLDINGDVIVAGDFPGSGVNTNTVINLGGGPVTVPSGGRFMFVVKYSGSTGAFVWQRIILAVHTGGFPADNGRINCIHSNRLDPLGTFTIVGYLQGAGAPGQYNFGNGIIVTGKEGPFTGFVAKFNSSGSVLWAKSMIGPPGAGDVTAFSCVMNSSAAPTFSGNYTVGLNYDGNSYPNSGAADLFLISAAP